MSRPTYKEALSRSPSPPSARAGSEETVTVVRGPAEMLVGVNSPRTERVKAKKKARIAAYKVKTARFLASFKGEAEELPTTEELCNIHKWNVASLRSLATACGLSPAADDSRAAVRGLVESYRMAAILREEAELVPMEDLGEPLARAPTPEGDVGLSSGEDLDDEIQEKERELAAHQAQLVVIEAANRRLAEKEARKEERSRKRARKIELEEAIALIEQRKAKATAPPLPLLEAARRRRLESTPQVADAGLRDLGVPRAGVDGFLEDGMGERVVAAEPPAAIPQPADQQVLT